MRFLNSRAFRRSALRPYRHQSCPRVALAKDLIADIRRRDKQLAASIASSTAVLDEDGTRLREIDGVGPVLAARLLGRTGTPSRYASYANYTGTAPVQTASAETEAHTS